MANRCARVWRTACPDVPLWTLLDPPSLQVGLQLGHYVFEGDRVPMHIAETIPIRQGGLNSIPFRRGASGLVACAGGGRAPTPELSHAVDQHVISVSSAIGRARRRYEPLQTNQQGPPVLGRDLLQRGRQRGEVEDAVSRHPGDPGAGEDNRKSALVRWVATAGEKAPPLKALHLLGR